MSSRLARIDAPTDDRVECKEGELLRLMTGRSRLGSQEIFIESCVLDRVAARSQDVRHCEEGKEIQFRPDRSISSCVANRFVGVQTPTRAHVVCKEGESLQFTVGDSGFVRRRAVIESCVLERIDFDFDDERFCQRGKEIQFRPDRTIASCASVSNAGVKTPTGSVGCKAGDVLRLSAQEPRSGRGRHVIDSCILDGMTPPRTEVERRCRRGMEVQFRADRSIESCAR
jgi:hypothetical protein